MRDDKSFPRNNLHDVLKPPFILSGRHGLIRVSGPEGADLLNRLSTNKVTGKPPGAVVETILTTDKGRIIDVLIALFRENDILLVTTMEKTDEVLAWLDKYTIMEDVRYTNLYAEYGVYDVVGAPEDGDSAAFGWEWEVDGFGLAGVLAAKHQSVRGAGVMAIVPVEMKEEFLSIITGGERHFHIATEAEYRLWRVKNGLPDVGYELTGLVNPLESGAADAVDFEKGCYIGQEVIARLDSYDKVQRRLKSVEFIDTGAISSFPGATLTSGGKNAGFLTTTEFDPAIHRTVGLACIRHAFADAGAVLEYTDGKTAYTLRVI